MTKAGAIDVGSNAIRYSIGEVTQNGTLKIIQSERKAVSLGRSVFGSRDRAIEPEILKQAIDALKGFYETFQNNNLDCYRAVGTSALRDAANGQDLVGAVSSFGLKLETIPGDEEARLIRRAVESSVNIKGENAALLDIGGGSAEFTLLKDGKVVFSVSERVGTIRLLKSLNEQKISTEKFSDRVRRVIEGLSEGISRSIQNMKIDVFLGTGGNVEELGNLRARIIKGKKKTNKVRFNELLTIIELLEPLTPLERQEKFGFRADRADVIFPAAVILREVMGRLNIDKVYIPNVGLKDGILIDLLGATSIKAD